MKQISQQIKHLQQNLKHLHQRAKQKLTYLINPLRFAPFKITWFIITVQFRIILKLLFFILITIPTWPFRKWTNFFFVIFLIFSILYVIYNEQRADILVEKYGGYDKLYCKTNSEIEKVKNNLVRIVGGWGEGTGFFINDHAILTNYHVIEGEPSPKIFFNDGSWITPVKITANKESDLALLYIDQNHVDKVLLRGDPDSLHKFEPLFSIGFPFGMEVKGEPTVISGVYNHIRHLDFSPVTYIQTDMKIIPGMSGGPLVDQCGEVIGINNSSVDGDMSFFISIESAADSLESFSTEDIAKIEINPADSPAEAVKAYYMYLKTRQMEKGFNLLSNDYLTRTNYREWSNRFTDIIDVQIYTTEAIVDKQNEVIIKFSTKNWQENDIHEHFYEGLWETVWEENKYKLNTSNVIEISDPDWDWFY